MVVYSVTFWGTVGCNPLSDKSSGGGRGLIMSAFTIVLCIWQHPACCVCFTALAEKIIIGWINKFRFSSWPGTVVWCWRAGMSWIIAVVKREQAEAIIRSRLVFQIVLLIWGVRCFLRILHCPAAFCFFLKGEIIFHSSSLCQVKHLKLMKTVA